MFTTLIKIFASTTLLFALTACGSGNSSFAPTTDSSGNHPANWNRTHKATAATSPASCTSCHGRDLAGGISNVSCMSPNPINGLSCHATLPVVAGQAVVTCVSCHGGLPSGPTGVIAPNRAGAHAKHLALNGVTCAACHNGAGSGTVLHADGTTNVLFTAAFNAKTGAASFNNNRCSSTSCHGGQTTPDWYTGAITVATGCLSCHQQGTAGNTPQTPQYNSFYSGSKTLTGSTAADNMHELHIALINITDKTSTVPACASCHNFAALAPLHFTSLANTSFTNPAATIGGGTTKITAYTQAPPGTCATSCHATRNWINP